MLSEYEYKTVVARTWSAEVMLIICDTTGAESVVMDKRDARRLLASLTETLAVLDELEQKRG